MTSTELQALNLQLQGEVEALSERRKYEIISYQFADRLIEPHNVVFIECCCLV